MGEGSGYRTWTTFADSDEVGLEATWKKAVVQLAIVQHGESERADEVAPDYDDAVSVFNDAVARKLLPWWPTRLERLLVKIKVTPIDQTTDTLGPTPVDPNNRDLGLNVFVNTVVGLLETQGEFDGRVQLEILRATNKVRTGGFAREVFVGSKSKKKGRGGGSDDKDELIKSMVDREKRQFDMIDKMFGNAAHNLGAAASVIQATRGVNPAPPWMQDGEGGSPLWMSLLNGAMQVGGALMSGKDTKQQIRQIMMDPVHPMVGGGQGQDDGQAQSAGGAPQLTDHGSEYGSDQFLEGGQYDGFRVVESDMLVEDGWEEDQQEQEQEQEEWDGEEYEEDDSEEDDPDESEEEDDYPRKKKSDDPFEGKSPEEVSALLEQWVDKNKGQKTKIMQLGMRLASKVAG